MYLDAIFTFICDSRLNGKSQVPEEFYIGSEIDSNDEQIVISKQELRQLHDENLELTKQNLAMSMVIQHGHHERVQPLKAPFDEVCCLTIESIKCYIASFKCYIASIKYFNKLMLMRYLEHQGDQFLAEPRDDEEPLLIHTVYKKLLLLLTIIVVVAV